MKEFRDTEEFKRGRIGEILQFHYYCSFGVLLADLADRTEKRAPLLHAHDATVISPDTLGTKSADFWLEFKTKTHHFRWKGGGLTDMVRIPPRTEEGIDEKSWRAYLVAGQRWKKPVILSFLSIQEGTIIAASLEQLGEPRFSPHQGFKLVNWDIRDFTLMASLNPKHLKIVFQGEGTKSRSRRERWLQEMPEFDEVIRVLDWMGVEQREIDLFRQFIFDETERRWHKGARYAK